MNITWPIKSVICDWIHGLIPLTINWINVCYFQRNKFNSFFCWPLVLFWTIRHYWKKIEKRTLMFKLCNTYKFSDQINNVCPGLSKLKHKLLDWWVYLELKGFKPLVKIWSETDFSVSIKSLQPVNCMKISNMVFWFENILFKI